MAERKLVFSILLLVSQALLIGIFSLIINKSIFTENSKFEFIYYISKIISIKNLVANNHNSEIINDFTPSGEASGLTTSYKGYLKLIDKDGCIQGYKPCGILDTLGHKLCIDEIFECPINSMKVDSIQRTDNYVAKNYLYAPLSNTTNNFRFFFSKSYIEGNAGVIIVKAKDDPPYLTKSNFMVDYDLYKEKFGDLKLIEDLSSILGMKNNENKTENNDDNEKIFKVVELLIDASSGGQTELYKLGAKGFLVLLTDSYNKQLERFKKYIERRLEEDEEVDKYFNHIGDNFYVKNYIGFKNAEDINKFLKFDYNILKKKFPSVGAFRFAIPILIIVCLFCGILIILIGTKDDHNYFKLGPLLAQIILIYFTSLGYIIYFLLSYFQVYKNIKLEELKSIQSDEFINNFINEFVSKCQDSNLIFYTVIIIGTSFLLFLITVIIKKCVKKHEKSSNKYY